MAEEGQEPEGFDFEAAEEAPLPPLPLLLLLLLLPSFLAPGSRVTVSLVGSNGGGPKSCGGGGCDDDEEEDEAEDEAETIRRSLFRQRRGRGRATTETATAAAAGAAGEQCGRRRASLRPATRKLALPAFGPPEVDAAAPLRARAAASGMSRERPGRKAREKREIEGRATTTKKKKRQKFCLCFSPSLCLFPKQYAWLYLLSKRAELSHDATRRD